MGELARVVGGSCDLPARMPRALEGSFGLGGRDGGRLSGPFLYDGCFSRSVLCPIKLLRAERQGDRWLVLRPGEASRRNTMVRLGLTLIEALAAPKKLRLIWPGRFIRTQRARAFLVSVIALFSLRIDIVSFFINLERDLKVEFMR